MRKYRKSLEIRQYDYKTKEEFLQHKEYMYIKGFKLTAGTGFEEMGLKSGEINGDDWTYTACYYKDL